jgi:hypothetical protein
MKALNYPRAATRQRAIGLLKNQSRVSIVTGKPIDLLAWGTAQLKSFMLAFAGPLVPGRGHRHAEA